MGLLLTQSACDLQPKIVSLPDTVGDFISARYPALLADPSVNPEIYNSAVTDYGVYASPDLYGTSDTDDYVLYASVDDYIVPPQADDSVVTEAEPVTDDAKSDDVVVATKNDVPQMTDYLLVPMYGGPEYASQGTEDVLKIGRPVSGVRTATRVELTDVTVGVGDTLYSLSRKYSVPVNDLAVLNELQPPFALRVGQKIRVPNLASAPVASVKAVEVKQVKSEPKTVVVDDKKVQKPAVQTVQKVATVAPKKEVVTSQKVVAKQEQKISSDPSKKLPKIAARSSSKFQWPVRGKVLSAYGAKSNGLFNDKCT